MVGLYYFKLIFTEKQPIFYLLIGPTICKHRTLDIIFLFSVIYNFCTSVNQETRIVSIIQNEKYLFVTLFPSLSQILIDLIPTWDWFSMNSAILVVTKLQYPTIQLFFRAIFEIFLNLLIRICNS